MESNDAATAAQQDLAKALNPRAGETVAIGYPHLDQFGANMVESTLRMIAYDKQHGNHLMHNSGLMNNGALAAVWGRSSELSHARNNAAGAFLSSDSDWLLWIDTDIGFEQDALERLLAVADPITAPIVGGLCFIEGDFTHDFRGGLKASLAPTLYDWAWIEPNSGMPGAYKLVTRSDWTEDAVTRVGATGCGFLLTHRSVYEKIGNWLHEQGAPPNIWFERIPGPDGEKCGEDVSFCLRAHQVDIPIFVHTGVITTHQKTVWYGADEYRKKPFTPPAMTVLPLPPEQWPKLYVNPLAAQQAARTSPMREQQVPEADEAVAVIVPVTGPEHAVTFLDSLADSLTEAQRGRVRVYAMTDAEDHDTQKAWLAATDGYGNVDINAHFYLRTTGSYAEKVNRGHLLSYEPWIFIVHDDVRFHAGWLDQAMQVARQSLAKVVGTNDLVNPAVTAGQHATNLLINRDYVDTVGASWDDPGIVCHEGYLHWYIDKEIVQAAGERGVWAPCTAAHVENLGRGRMDAAWALAQAAAPIDQAAWESRVLGHL